MKNLSLNLVKPENSDIEFKKTQFPDGQQDIQITSIFKTTEIYSPKFSQKDLKMKFKTNYNIN